ncbi:Metallothionein expression activator [Knufia obscura]|uniref:Metallothionein expression activator n=1 Tax=Knufia obscura TaxID=1635080 RepID=A0ABR0RQL6_9EURO|nr:Metallothionein expression activator [Knufia obscura]
MPMPLSAESQSPYMFDENSQHYFQAMHQMQEAAQMMPQTDRRMSQPDLRIQTGIRPYTPQHQLQTAHFPLTPAQTPMHQQNFQETKSLQTSPRWHPQDDNIVSPRPVSMQKSRSLQGIAEHQEMHSFDVFDAPNLAATQGSHNVQEPVKQRRPAHIKTSSVSAVKTDSKQLFGEISGNPLRLEEQSQPTLSSSKGPSSPTRPALSPRRMSISDLNLEPGISASIEETNVTLDEIAQFIDGPDSENKWTCKFDGCDKKFGRKENIKSHVQTHLGDRQFRCDHCKKCFVRGHDLKRHAKIHTGSKAYACLCGNAFARHDALTRHRQRGMCIGAFEGIVRKEIKRGRPRKHRPEMDDRVNKASRTRQRKAEGPTSHHGGSDPYASSASNYSISSWGSPPTETLDHLSIQGDHPSPNMTYDDTMNIFGFSSQGMEMSSQTQIEPLSQVALPPDMFSYTPPASPGYSTGNKPSPNNYRELTPAELASFDEETNMTQKSGQPINELDLLPAQASHFSHQMLDESTQSTQAAIHPSTVDTFDLPSTTQAQFLSATQATSLPSLSHSSSPPPQEVGHALVFDYPEDMNPLRMSTMSNISNMTFGLSATTKAMISEDQNDSQETSRNEFDSFLDYNDDSQMGMGMSVGMDNSDSFFANM